VAALAATLVLAAPLPVLALVPGRLTTHVRERGPSRIEINDHGVTVVTRARASASSDSASASDSTRAAMPGVVDAGPIVVRGGDNGIVRLFSDAVVPAGERVDGDVVAVFGSVRVEGEVEGTAVAVFGSLDLRRGAVVRGDAVAVGGTLREGDGSRVEGQTVQVGFLPLTFGLPGLPFVLTTIAVLWLVWLFFAWVLAVLFPARLARVAVTASRRTVASLLVGIASGPSMCMFTLVLIVTVLGILVAWVPPIAYVAVLFAGQLAATYVLGCKLMRRRLGAGGVMAPIVSGSLLVASIFGFGAILWDTPGIVRTAALFFLMVGALLLMGLSTIGTGAFILSRAGSRPTDIDGLAPGGTPDPVPVVDPTTPVPVER